MNRQPALDDAELQRRRRRRSYAIAIALGVAVVIFYVLTIVKMGPAALGY